MLSSSTVQTAMMERDSDFSVPMLIEDGTEGSATQAGSRSNQAGECVAVESKRGPKVSRQPSPLPMARRVVGFRLESHVFSPVPVAQLDRAAVF
jgi:hypothetical protein